ncbi:MAG: hypothetical protein JNL04_23495 [Rhodospirillaceae bacterium]|nr:hypothetical protein [Rhodospirillaceae bacterium]
MRELVARFRWTSWLAASALAFQVFALVLTTPMEVARGLPAVAEHCAPEGHHGAPAGARDVCQICIGMQVAGTGVAPVAPALPLPVFASFDVAAAVTIEAPPLNAPRPQNPRAPPILI